MNGGYTLLWRRIWNNPVLHQRDKKFSRLEAWLYLVNVMAQGVDTGTIGRGEFQASYRYLARAWHWSIACVFRFMSQLESNQMIKRVEHPAEHLAEHLPIHFIICNYSTYNPSRNTERNTERNKLKEGIKEGEKISSQAAGAAAVESLPSVDAYRLSELLRRAIQVRDPKAKAAALPDLRHWARDIDKLIRLDGRRAEDIEAVIAWCQKDGCFWNPIILSGRKLREKFDTLWGQLQLEKGGKRDTPGLFNLEEPPGSTSSRRTKRGDPIYIPKQ